MSLLTIIQPYSEMRRTHKDGVQGVELLRQLNGSALGARANPCLWGLIVGLMNGLVFIVGVATIGTK